MLLLLGLLGGGLVCLLVVNTTLAANSIEITRLEQHNAASTQHVQQLEQVVAQESSAGQIAKEAKRLGMRPDTQLTFIDLRTKSLVTQPGLTGTELTGSLVATKLPKRGQAERRRSVTFSAGERVAGGPATGGPGR